MKSILEFLQNKHINAKEYTVMKGVNGKTIRHYIAINNIQELIELLNHSNIKNAKYSINWLKDPKNHIDFPTMVRPKEYHLYSDKTLSFEHNTYYSNITKYEDIHCTITADQFTQEYWSEKNWNTIEL